MSTASSWSSARQDKGCVEIAAEILGCKKSDIIRKGLELVFSVLTEIPEGSFSDLYGKHGQELESHRLKLKAQGDVLINGATKLRGVSV